MLITRRSQVQILPPLPTSQQVRGPFPLGEGLLLSARVAKCVARVVTESPGSRHPARRMVTIEHDCDADDGDRWVSLRTMAGACFGVSPVERCHSFRVMLCRVVGPSRE